MNKLDIFDDILFNLLEFYPDKTKIIDKYLIKYKHLYDYKKLKDSVLKEKLRYSLLNQSR